MWLRICGKNVVVPAQLVYAQGRERGEQQEGPRRVFVSLERQALAVSSVPDVEIKDPSQDGDGDILSILSAKSSILPAQCIADPAHTMYLRL